MRLLIRAGNSPFQVAEARPPERPGFGNTGNVLFAHAVYKSLCQPRNHIDVNGYRPDFATAEEINERYDAFVLPLANAFRPTFEAQLRQHTALIRRLKIPCVVVGIGAQAGLDLAELQGSPLDPEVRAFVAAVLDRSATIGVRGEITADYLRRLGFDAVDVIGCPSLFLVGANLRVRKSKGVLETDDPIAVNFTPGVGPPSIEFVRTALTAYPNGIFVSQGDGNDLLWDQAVGAVAPDDVAALVTRPADGKKSRVRLFRDVPPWLAFMMTRVFSVGPRIHGNIAALLAGIPAVAIAHDSRTLEICRYHRLPHVLEGAVDATPLAALYEAADFAPANATAPGLFDRYREFLAKNGLDHALDDPRNAAAHEARLATLAFPNGLPV